MPLGHPSASQWGGLTWGSQAFEPAVFVGIDAVSEGTLTATAAVDAIAGGLNTTLTASLDGLAEGALEVAAALDVFQGRVPTADYLAECNSPLVLVEIRLISQTLRFSTIPTTFGGFNWAGRLVSAGVIERTEVRGTDDVRLVMDDSDQDAQSRLRDVFLADPPEGAGVSIYVVMIGDVSSQRSLVFEGRIEEVVGFTRSSVSVDVLRNEAVEDVPLGRPVTVASFPNAPDDSLGAMIPIVFGEVEDHEGLAVDVNGVTKLEVALDPTTTTLLNPAFPVVLVFPVAGGPAEVPTTDAVSVRDASVLPSAATVQVEGEQIRYTSIVGNELRGVTRGANGTSVQEHARGADVEEVGDFTVVLMDHPASKIERIRILASDGNLGPPVPEPSVVDFTNALITWPETPRVRDSSGSPVYLRVHFGEADPTNLAANADSAARESLAYQAFGFASLASGQLVLRTNAQGLGVPGDLQRVWLGVIFEPDSLGLPASAGLGQVGSITLRPRSTQVLGIPGSASVVVSGRAFPLEPTDVVPPEIARNDERTGDRLFDVPDPVFDVVQGAGQDVTLSPSDTIDPGIWVFERISARVIDENVDTEAVAFFAGVGEVQLIGTADAIFRLTNPPDLRDDVPTAAVLTFVAGWGPPFTQFTSPMQVRLVDRVTGEILTILEARSGVGVINGVETFTISFDPALLGTNLSRVPDLDWIVSPTLGVVSGLWVGRELTIELTTERQPPPTTATIDPRGTVTNYIEVTDLIGINPASPDASAPWSFFSDLSRGGRVTIRSNVAGVVPNIIEVFWVAQHVPFLEAATSVPRVFADVRGITGPAASSTPADVSEAIVTGIPPLGMGLPVSVIAREAYNPTKASLVADGIVQGFSVREPTSSVALLQAIADQGDCRQTWDRGRHNLIRRPRADVSLTTFRTLTGELDILTQPEISLARTPISEARTRIVGRYRRYAPSGDLSRSLEVIDAGQETRLGIQADTVDLGLVRLDAAALVLITRSVERRARPRWQLRFVVPLLGLELRFGDLVTVRHIDIPGGEFEVCEVVGLSLVTTGLDRISVVVVVWKE